MLCPGTKRGAICKNNMISWRFEAAEHEFGREWLSNCSEDSSSSSMNLCCYRQSFFCFYTREEGWFCMARAWRRQWRIDVNSNSIFLCTDSMGVTISHCSLPNLSCYGKASKDPLSLSLLSCSLL
jgi:hypothetical protein